MAMRIDAELADIRDELAEVRHMVRWRPWKIFKAIGALKLGDPEASVHQLLGMPDERPVPGELIYKYATHFGFRVMIAGGQVTSIDDWTS
ncbi:MAG TPA: hypothetical protein VGD50_00910 [Candidatus Baltobacteraceae bacterium]